MAKRRKQIIHVNQLIIRGNQKTGERNPPLTLKVGRKNTRAFEIEGEGKFRIVYRPDAPLSCGARVWIETYGDVTPITEMPDGSKPKAEGAGLQDACKLPVAPKTEARPARAAQRSKSKGQPSRKTPCTNC